MKLTIIPSDNAVYKNLKFNKDLLWDGTPENVHALQWENDLGWIEYSNEFLNETITQLPDWALNALAAWEMKEANLPIQEEVPAEVVEITKEDLLLQLKDIQTQIENLI
jgi:hypothetical protein